MKRYFSLFLFWFFICFSSASFAGLPASAQQAMKDGLGAAQERDYTRALGHFMTAHRAAPDSPDVLFNIALAESKIPGRELRAVAWFGAYLAAKPGGENTGDIQRQVARLQETNEKIISKTLDLYKSAIEQLPAEMRPHYATDIEVKKNALESAVAARKMPNEWTGDPAPLAAAARGDFKAAYHALADISDVGGRNSQTIQVCAIKRRLLESAYQPGPVAWTCGDGACQSSTDWMNLFKGSQQDAESLDHPVFIGLSAHLTHNPSKEPDIQVVRIRESLAAMIDMTKLVDAMLKRQAAARGNARTMAESALHEYIEENPQRSAEQDTECDRLNQELNSQIQHMLNTPLPPPPVAPRASGY